MRFSKKLQKHFDEVVQPCWNYAKRCESFKDHVNNAVLGLAGEAGETADQVKKFFYHTEKPVEFHRDKIVQELGDVEFYKMKLMDLLNITQDEVLAANRAKLQSRHPELGKVEERFADGYIK